jgi:hypothetical protein
MFNVPRKLIQIGTDRSFRVLNWPVNRREISAVERKDKRKNFTGLGVIARI